MKEIILTSISAISLMILISSCTKEDEKYCYTCSATPIYSGVSVSETECDLSKSERDKKVDQFNYNYNASNNYSTSCSKTSE